MKNPLFRRHTVGFLISLVAILLSGVFFAAAGADIAENGDPEQIPRPDRPMPEDLKRDIDVCLFWDPKSITVSDIDKPFEVTFLMNPSRNPVPFSGRVGRITPADGYWRIEHAALEIGDAVFPLEVPTLQKSCWPATINTPFPRGRPVEPTVKGYIDVSRVPKNRSLPCRAILEVAYPQRIDSEHYENKRQVLQVPFRIVTLSESDWTLASAWSDYERYLRILDTRSLPRWILTICGVLMLLASVWFHMSARVLRSYMDVLARVQQI